MPSFASPPAETVFLEVCFPILLRQEATLPWRVVSPLRPPPSVLESPTVPASLPL